MIRIRVIPLLNSIQNPLGSEGFQWQFPFSSLVSLQRQSKCSGRHKGLQARQARTHARSNRQLLINSAKTFFPPFSLSQRLPPTTTGKKSQRRKRRYQQKRDFAKEFSFQLFSSFMEIFFFWLWQNSRTAKLKGKDDSK